MPNRRTRGAAAWATAPPPDSNVEVGEGEVGTAIVPVEPAPAPSPRPAKPFSIHHDTLTKTGECKPGFYAHNVQKYGYESLRRHFIEGHEALSTSQLAEVWGLSYAAVKHLSDREGWAKARGEWQLAQRDKIERERALMRDGAKAEQLRADFEELELANFRRAGELAMERLEERTEEAVAPNGIVAKIRKTSGSFKADVASLTAISNQVRLNLGMATKTPIQVAGTINNTQISVIQETRPSETDTRAYLMDTLRDVLPESVLDEDEMDLAIAEGEVM